MAQNITSSWEKVEARITIEEAMTSFLTQGLDECGATICLAAFKLVSHVLDKGGYVRRVHKSANTPLSSILTNTEGPWVEKGKDVDRHWDYSSTWLKGIENIGLKAKKDNTYFPFGNKLVFEKFCEPIEQPSASKTGTPKKVQPMRGSNRATFSRGTETKDDPETS